MDVAETLITEPKRISIKDMVLQAQRAVEMVSQVRGRMLSPNARKMPPTFSGAQVAALCGIDKNHLAYRVSKGDLPPGTVKAPRSPREFTLAEARAWSKAYRKSPLRPEGARACVIAVGNFKGGSSKTTTTMTLGQGLSLRGHRCLLIDLDPQGSLTTLFGILPDTEVADDETVSPLCFGDQTGVRYAVRPTYWDGIDLVPASPSLFAAEFALPARQTRDVRFRFWDVLNVGLDDVRNDYDVILIDTPPALSYLSVNGFMAADGLVVPMPPNALDYASSAQFWNLFSDLAASIAESKKIEKAYDFIHVLLSRVDMSDAAAGVVRSWITATYAEKVLPVEIPKTAVASSSSAEFGTVYDVSRYEGSQKTYQRAREAYDRFTEIMEQAVMQSWAQQGR
jgi:chromosome partitioning protein